MDNFIQISKLNDFIFCPKSIYYHAIYESFSEDNYHSHYQTTGKLHHENIDNVKYSSALRYIQGMTVYSDRLNLVGKIDIYDQKEKSLIERKYKIKTIFDGYKYQLYSQFFCLKEMGYVINKLYFHSLSDNKRYQVTLPTQIEYDQLLSLCQKIQNYKIEGKSEEVSNNKCQQCIYSLLCN